MRGEVELFPNLKLLSFIIIKLCVFYLFCLSINKIVELLEMRFMIV